MPRKYGYRGVRLHINVFLSRGKESVCHKSWEKPTPSLWMKSQSRYRVYFYFLKGPFICQVDIKCDVRKEIGVLWDGWQLFWYKAEVLVKVFLNLIIYYSVVLFFFILLPSSNKTNSSRKLLLFKSHWRLVHHQVCMKREVDWGDFDLTLASSWQPLTNFAPVAFSSDIVKF